MFFVQLRQYEGTGYKESEQHWFFSIRIDKKIKVGFSEKAYSKRFLESAICSAAT